jgi:molybdopterin-containing oxidoreductase family membrane subunit
MPTLVGIYEQPGFVVGAVQQLKGRGFGELETYSPAPFPEIDDAVDDKPSGVRLYTLIGGLAGVVTGYALTLWMSNNWPIVVGWKPISSIPPYTIIGFELTILFGGLMTLIGLIVKAKLGGGFDLGPVYSSRFSAEEFGVAVRCEDRDVAEVEALLRSHHAREVNLVDA